MVFFIYLKWYKSGIYLKFLLPFIAGCFFVLSWDNQSFAFLLQNIGGHSSLKEVKEDLGHGLSRPKGGLCLQRSFSMSCGSAATSSACHQAIAVNVPLQVLQCQ